jgi:hypothetical protein
MISGFRFGFLGINDVPLFTTVGGAGGVYHRLLPAVLVSDPARTRSAQLTFSPATFCCRALFFDSYHRKLTFTPLNYLPAKEGVMLGWVITCHDEQAQEMLDRLKPVWSAGAVPGGKLLARVEHQYAEPDDVRCAA